MDYRYYRVYCFKGVDYIATKENDLDKIMEFYRHTFDDDLELNEVKEIEDKNKEFILINEETNYKEVTTYNKLIKEYAIITDDADFLYLCSTEW